MLYKPSTDSSEEESLGVSKTLAMPIFLIGNKMDKLDRDGQKSKTTIFRKFMEDIFDNDPALRYSFMSKDSGIHEFVQMENFIVDCIANNQS